jgi:hypothetical protein
MHHGEQQPGFPAGRPLVQRGAAGTACLGPVRSLPQLYRDRSGKGGATPSGSPTRAAFSVIDTVT